MTEEVCGPLLAKISGLTRGKDFKLGYSPERINPGDKEHTLERITKVVSGEDAATLERVAAAYGAIIDAGIHRASSIKVAEAAKVIENTQRDLNIALMNELAIIFERLESAPPTCSMRRRTKWNFLKFRPGLVGGHCIGVDPYYLTMKAQQLGYQPEVILAGRRINNNVGPYVAQRLVKMLINQGIAVKGARVGRPRADLQGGLQRPAQQQGPGHPEGAARLRHQSPHSRSAAATRPRPSTSTASR